MLGRLVMIWLLKDRGGGEVDTNGEGAETEVEKKEDDEEALAGRAGRAERAGGGRAEGKEGREGK